MSLDYEELESSQALEGTEELWSLEACLEDLLRLGKDEELASMRDFCVYKLVPLAETTLEEHRKAIPTRWANTWDGEKLSVGEWRRI